MSNPNVIVGYIIEPSDFEKLEWVISKLHSGTDHERDLGHILWCIAEYIKDWPITDNDLNQKAQS